MREKKQELVEVNISINELHKSLNKQQQSRQLKHFAKKSSASIAHQHSPTLKQSSSCIAAGLQRSVVDDEQLANELADANEQTAAAEVETAAEGDE